MKPISSTDDSVTTSFLTLRLKLRRIAGTMLRCDDDADDTLQETFIRAWQSSCKEALE